MSTFMLKSNTTSFTPISNIFIEKYMPSARGEFVKIYLLLNKYIYTNEPGVNSTILASSLNLLESDVMNALNYWNDQGVIKLIPIDKMNNYSIELCNLEIFNQNVTTEVNLLEAFDKSETKEMLKDIEKILGRTLSPKEMEIYLGWQKDFGFTSELILILVEYCASKGKVDYRYIEKVALSWNDQGINTIEKVQTHIRQNEDKWTKIRQILSYLGITNPEIMKPQEDLLTKWINTYNYDLPVIKKACDICFQRLNRADFKYIDGILSKWFKDNLKTLEDVEIKDKAPLSSYSTKQNSYNKQPQKSSNFNNFEPRSNDFKSIEEQLLGWDKHD